MSALLLCARQNMTLATVADAAEQALIEQCIDAPSDAASATPIDHFWMGANNQHNAAEYAWIGSGQPVGAFGRWATGYPSAAASQCVFVQREVHTWVSNPCDRHAFVVCEFYHAMML